MAVIVVMLVGFSLGVSWIVQANVTSNRQSELIVQGKELAITASSYLKGENSYATFLEAVNELDNVLNIRVWVVDTSYQLIATSVRRGQKSEFARGPANKSMHSPGMQNLSQNIEGVFEGNTVVKSIYHPYYSENMMLVAVPVYEGDTIKGAVVLSTPIKEMNAFLGKIYHYIAMTSIIAIIIALFIVNKLSHEVVSPLREMQYKASRMAKGDYSQKIVVRTRDEVGELGHALNLLGQDLEQFVCQIKKTDKMRRDFVANVSHELRTPLTIIRGYHEAIIDETVTDPEQIIKYQRVIGDEIVRLERLISELLDLSKLQSGKQQVAKEKIPLANLAGNVVAMVQQKAAQFDINLGFVNDGLEAEIWGNGDRLTQLILILIDNAIRYTNKYGQVLVSVLLKDEEVELKVSDTGVGISKEDLPHIWERFFKVDKAHTRSTAGTGLGLAIAKEIIDLHEAKAKVISQLGQGTEFSIVFQKK